MKIFPLQQKQHIFNYLLLNYEYLGTSDTGELAFKEKITGSFIILTSTQEYIYCKVIHP